MAWLPNMRRIIPNPSLHQPRMQYTAEETTHEMRFEVVAISSYVVLMSKKPLVDRSCLIRNRARKNSERGDFLHNEAILDVQDRLTFVNKEFSKVAIVTGMPEVWSKAFPKATVVLDDEVLDLGQGSYDLIIHGMSLHWANDPVGQLIQMRRALSPDGLMIAAFLGGDTLNELRSSLAEAEIAVSGGLSPRVLPMGEIRDAGSLLQRAGFALPVADSAKLSAEYDNIFHLMSDLRGMGEANAMTDRLKSFTRRDVFTRANEIYAASFSNSADKCVATFEILMLTGWAPDESQPKPLRPGSATMRLAEALGTQENQIKN